MARAGCHPAGSSDPRRHGGTMAHGVRRVDQAIAGPDPALKTMPGSGQAGLELSRVSTAQRRLRRP